MLAKKARLTSREVEEVLTKGRSLAVSPKKGQKTLISLKFLATPGRFQAAAIAPKSVAKSAVVRNSLRRAVYRAVASLPAPKISGKAVFFVRSIPKKPFTPAFAEEVEALLQKISDN
jgi:RNase P protein component